MKSASFKGNPFSQDENDIVAVFATPNHQSVSIHAFYDGDNLWKIRFSPAQVGEYRYRVIPKIGVRLISAPSGSFRVVASSAEGFIRLSKKFPRRFAFDEGDLYYPVGHDVAWMIHWEKNYVDFDHYFQAMHHAGENYARVWMSAWGGLDLDANADKLGQYDLKAARYLDRVFNWAQANGIHLQLTLQYHGQFSTRVNPNWLENPWNETKGGILKEPSHFYISNQAKILFKRKLSYLIARWGYSPNLMSWELFNEVQFTDLKNWEDVAKWHDEMAAFLRRSDPNHHLVTTSSPPANSPVWRSMDYLQAHNYRDDPLVSAVSEFPPVSMKKPSFVGEWGAANGSAPDGNPADFLHDGLWAGMMSGASAAPMFWAWDFVEKRNLYSTIGDAARFAKMTHLSDRGDLISASAVVESDDLGPLVVSPGSGWEELKRFEFVINSNAKTIIDGLPTYIQGRAHREMMPHSPALLFDIRKPTEATLEIAQVATAGAQMSLSLDNVAIQSRDFPENSRENDKPILVKINLPAGKHRLTISNDGVDWFRLSRITLADYTPRLQARVLTASDYAIVWVFNDAKELGVASGVIGFKGLKPGRYQLVGYEPETMKKEEESILAVKGSDASIEARSIQKDRVYVLRRL